MSNLQDLCQSVTIVVIKRKELICNYEDFYLGITFWGHTV